MIGLTIICAGRIKEKYFAEASAEYIKRLGTACTVDIIEIREERMPDIPSPAQVGAALERESVRILDKIPRGAYTFALCVEGKELSSEEFSHKLTSSASQCSRLCFIIGSSNGLHDNAKHAAHERLSLSRMTLPHSLARVMLLEQLYRAFNIAAGGKYHK